MTQEYIARKYVSSSFVSVVVEFFGHDFFQIWPFSKIFLRPLSELEMQVMKDADRAGTLKQAYQDVKAGKYVTRKERRTNQGIGKNAS